MEKTSYSDEDIKNIIKEAADKAQENQIKADQERVYERQDPLENFERPEVKEDLSEPGEHTLTDFNNLAHIGKESSTFEWGGNQITIRTLTQKEEIDILSRCNRYPPTAQDRVYNTYCAAVALEALNGEPFFKRLPVTNNQDLYSYKFDYFQNEISPIVINKIITEYISLRREANEKARFIKKK